MKIKESKNLKYSKTPKLTDSFEELNLFEPRICILENFKRLDDKLELYFKNSTQAVIIAKNIAGGSEIDLLNQKLPELIGKSYEEILQTDF